MNQDYKNWKYVSCNQLGIMLGRVVSDEFKMRVQMDTAGSRVAACETHTFDNGHSVEDTYVAVEDLLSPFSPIKNCPVRNLAEFEVTSQNGYIPYDHATVLLGHAHALLKLAQECYGDTFRLDG